MLVDSKKQVLKPPQIIQNVAEQQDIKNVKKMMATLSVEFNMPHVWKCQQGNTLFIVHKSQHPGYGYFRALNADTAPNYLQNSRDFIDAAYKVGFRHLVTQFTDPSLLNLFKIISRNPMREDMGFTSTRTNDGGFQAIVQLGPLEGGK